MDFNKEVFDMSNLKFGAICSHGLPEIPTIAGDEKPAFTKIRKAMEKLAEDIIAENVDTIIIMTPHGLRVDGCINIYNCCYTSGKLSYNSEDFGFKKDNLKDTVVVSNHVEHLSFECDRKLAQSIYKTALDLKLPVVSSNYGVKEGKLSDITMDWGVFVPLWFLRSLQDKVKLVVIDPSRMVKLDDLKRFGQVLKTEIEKSTKKVGIIASADHGHAHIENGPMGYRVESKQYDELVLDLIKSDNMQGLLSLDKELVENAAVDSLWQMVPLHGALEDSDLKLNLCEYDVPTYFGMIVAGFF